MKRGVAVGAVLALALAIACQIPDRHFQMRDGGGSAADAPADRAIDAPPPCNPAAPFGSGILIAELNTGSNQAMEPRLTHDELQIYYWTRVINSGSGGELWTAIRSTPGGTFGTPQRMTTLDVGGTERDPTVTADNLTIYYAVYTGSPDDIYTATRTNPAVAFGSGAPVAGINGSAQDFGPYVMPDNLTLYLSTNTGSADDLAVSSRPNLGTNFGTPDTAPFATINLASYNERNPVVTIDGLRLYFATNRDGTSDIYTASRTSTSVPFDTPTKVTELSASTAGEFPGWISDDGCRLYFDYTATGTYQYEVYVATKPPF